MQLSFAVISYALHLVHHFNVFLPFSCTKDPERFCLRSYIHNDHMAMSLADWLRLDCIIAWLCLINYSELLHCFGIGCKNGDKKCAFAVCESCCGDPFFMTTKSRAIKQAESNSKLDALRENKPPPNMAIRRIRILDFGLPDPKRDLDRHQNCTTWSLSHALPLQKISSKSVHKFVSNPTADRQTDRQTDRTKNITSFFGGGNYKVHICIAKLK